MAVSFRHNTFGYLDAWRQRMRVSDWRFNQVTGAGVYAPLGVPGGQPFIQDDRECVAEGLSVALEKIVTKTRFYPRPVYLRDRIQVTQNQSLSSQLLTTNYRYIEAIGKRGLTIIQAGAAVVYSDEDGDGVDETATITVATTLTDVTEIQAFFKVADSGFPAADERWQITPLTVTANGVNATLTGHRSLFVDPFLWKNPFAAPDYNNLSIRYADTMTPSDFVTTVDVYRVYPDTTDAVTISCQNGGCCGTATYNAFTDYEGTASIVDADRGIIRVTPNECSCTCVDRVGVRYINLWYKAGYPLDFRTGLPDSMLELALIKLSNAESPWRTPDEDPRNNVWYGDAQMYGERQLPPNLLNCPFGLRVGQVEAWRIVRGYMFNSIGPLGQGAFR